MTCAWFSAAWAIALALVLVLLVVAAQRAEASSGVLVVVPENAEWVDGFAKALRAVGHPVAIHSAPAASLLQADWVRAIEAVDAAVRAEDPEWVLLAWGDGEAQPVRADDGELIAWGDARWHGIYTERVGAVASLAAGRRGMWVGPRTHPHPNTNLRQAAIALWIRATLQRLGGWHFADAFSATADGYGRYHLRIDEPAPTRHSMAAGSSAPLRVRASGRLTPAGADVFAGWLVGEWERASRRE